MQNSPLIKPYFDIVDALSPQDCETTVKLGVRHETFQRNVNLKLSTMIAQYYGIVKDGLIIAEHAFRGLKRPLLHADDMHADESVVVYAWRPTFDYEWTGYRHDGKITSLVPPPGRVFVVLVREMPIDSWGVSGTIERWNWVREDPELRHAPVDYRERYKEPLWSKI